MDYTERTAQRRSRPGQQLDLALAAQMLIKSSELLMNNEHATSRWVAEKLAEPQAQPSDSERLVLAEVLRGMRRIHHGSIQLIVQDGRVIQVDTLEKRRL